VHVLRGCCTRQPVLLHSRACRRRALATRTYIAAAPVVRAARSLALGFERQTLARLSDGGGAWSIRPHWHRRQNLGARRGLCGAAALSARRCVLHGDARLGSRCCRRVGLGHAELFRVSTLRSQMVSSLTSKRLMIDLAMHVLCSRGLVAVCALCESRRYGQRVRTISARYLVSRPLSVRPC